ncbi:MAG: hypothetical protein KC419_18720 [Anaerolineales bacterium]|nr:hypothetical protein [Anaerolineales bacterium]MCA9930528.1 hypothetical protein [Anaerolineales bacterium]
MHIFIAGIMQANRSDKYIESQDYRARIASALRACVPDVQITDPFAANPNSVHYDDDQARYTFLTNTKRAADVDVLLAYVPLPSMGTAMEMWEASQAGAYVVVVTPYIHNWAMKFTSDEILPDLDSLIAAIENGRIHHWAKKRNNS